jgi:SAM-dependent methyltransferase
MDTEWYRSFFRGIALDLWRVALPPDRTRAEADFLARALHLAPGARVLDVPCGLGRHSIELAARGFRMTGVDLSEEAIAEAREHAAEKELGVEWRQGDMRALPRTSQFDAAFCFGNSFGYLDLTGTRDFVGAVAAALKPGSRFALDTGMAAECILPRLQEREWSQIGDILFLEENRYHLSEGCIETTYTFVRGGETVTRTGLHWVYTLREIRSLLAEAGLVVERISSSLEDDPFRLGSPYLVVVAQRS